MAKVVEMERARVERLATELLPYLSGRGSLGAVVAELDDVARWRRAARRAGRQLGWRVRTGLSPDGCRVWAVSQDFPVSLREQYAAIERFTRSLVE